MLLKKFLLTATSFFLLHLSVRAEPLINILHGDGIDHVYAYVAPNEFEYYRFNPALKGKTGALIAVGTFRFFHDLSQGEFNAGIAFDYSPEIVNFNLGLMNLFLAARDRHDFLRLLMGQPPEFLDLLRRVENSEVSGQVLMIRAKKLKDQMIREARHPATAYFPQNVDISALSDFGYRLVQFFSNPKTRETTFLGSDLQFNKVKRLIQNGRVVVVNGNLGGTESLKKVGLILRSQKISVSVFDISNAYKYIADSELMPQGPERYLTNLRTLPFSKDAVILKTEGQDIKSAHHGDGWNYFAFPYLIYLLGAEKFITSYLKRPSYETSYWGFMENVATRYQRSEDRSLCLFIF